MRSFTILVVPTLILLLGVVSTTFSLLAATSNRWAVQKYFFTPPVGSYNSSIYDHVTCEAHRSPFYRCGIPSVDENGTCTIESCQFYPPRGVNRTSCRLPVEVGSIHEDNVTLTGVVGQYAECQQVHLAGNLQIAASTFTGLGLILAVLLQLIALVVALRSPSHGRHDETVVVVQGAESSTTQIKPHQHHHQPAHHGQPNPSRHRQHGTRTLTLILILSLVLGAVLQLLAQFFGVLSQTVLASPAATVVNSLPQIPRGMSNFVATDWMLDIGLTRYASVAWAFSLAGGALAGLLLVLGRRSGRS